MKIRYRRKKETWMMIKGEHRLRVSQSRILMTIIWPEYGCYRRLKKTYIIRKFIICTV